MWRKFCSDGKCIGECSIGYVHEDEYGTGTNPPSGKCVKCKYEEDIKKCYVEIGGIKNPCTNFAPNENDENDFSCLLCPEGRFSDTGSKCNNCLDNCAKCSSEDKCERCFEKYFLQKGNNDENDECIKCTVTGDTCKAGSNTCKGYEPNGSTCQLCRLGSYSIDGKKCVKCGCKDGDCDQYSGECPDNGDCEDGYYKREGVCVKCPEGCLKCSAEKDCTECDVEAGYILHNGEKNECLKCNRIDGKCQYTKDEIEICSEYGYNEENQKCQKCRNGIFPEGDGIKCNNCMKGCEECKNANQCDSCKDGFYITSDKQCLNCPDNCLKCDKTDPKKCLQCNNGFYATASGECINCHCKGKCDSTSGKCLGDCEAGFSHFNGEKCFKCLVNDAKEICEFTDSSFSSSVCKGHDLNCRSCPKGTYSHDGKECVNCNCNDCDPIKGCSGVCEIGYAKSEDSDICDICAIGYALDKNKNYRCSKCDEGYYKNGEGKCVKCNCAEGIKCDVNGKCTDGKCANGYIFVESYGLCFKCSENIKKKACFYEIGKEQEVCKGFELSSEGICKKCEDGKFSSEGKKCESCTVQYCKKCSEEDTCDQCYTNYFLADKDKCDNCIDNCAKCSDSNTCDICEDQYILAEVEGNKKCIKCIPKDNICKYTFGNENNNCKGFEVITDKDDKKICKACDEGYFSDGDKCNKCQHNCAECSDSSNCNKCLAGYFIGELVNGSPCNSCSDELENCAECDSATECNKCIGGYYKSSTISNKNGARTSRIGCFNCHCDGLCDGETGGCSGDCLEGYYHENKGEKCVNCAQFSEKCIKCDAEKCLDCSEGFKVDTNNADQCIVKTCEDGCSVCDKGICITCKDKYFLTSNKKCEHCSSSCATCATTESQCTSCYPPLFLNNGKCDSCFNKFYGCESSSCTIDSCTKCLEYFKTTNEGQCDKSKEVELPKFTFAGFGKYHKNESKIYFRLYLKLQTSMMYNSQVTFNLKITSNGQSTIINEGKGVQTGTADGYLAENPTGSNTLVSIDCEIKYENEIPENAILNVENLFVVLINGETTNIPITDAKLGENISIKTGDEVEEEAKKKGNLYTFDQSEQSCENDGTKANLKLIGNIKSKDAFENEEFNVKTSGKNARCKLNKAADSNSATLDCIVTTDQKGFTIANQDITIENKLTVSLVMKGAASTLCAISPEPEECSVDYCSKCTGKTCTECESGYYLSKNYCFACPYSCGSTCSAENCQNCPDGLFLDKGKCISCYQKFKGCQSNSCSSESCHTCLKEFKTDTPGKCNTDIEPYIPEFEYRGFGKFRREGPKISFRLYLKLKKRYMFNCQITFDLKITYNKRFLTDQIYTGGTGFQTGSADGDQADNPSASANTAYIDCTIETNDGSDFPIGTTTVYNVKHNLVNDQSKEGDIVVDSTIDIKTKTENEIELQDAEDGYIYYFTQTDCSCKTDGQNAILLLNGKVKNVEKNIDTEYDSFITSVNNGKCKLSKKTSETDATLSCTIPTNKKQFTIDTQTLKKKYDSTASIKINDGQVSCSVNDQDNDGSPNDKSGGNSSSSGGISGGAVAGIVIGVIAGLAIIGGVIFSIFKFGGSKQVIQQTSSVNPEVTRNESTTNGKLKSGYAF